MKIGIYSPYLDTLTGGERYIFTCASCLSGEHDITVFWNDDTILQKASKKFNLNLQKIKIADNIFSKNTGLLKRLFESKKYDRIIYLSDGSIPIVASKKLLVHFQFPIEWVNAKNILYKLKKRRISKIFCNSYFTKNYIDKKLGVESLVLYPPVEIGKYEKEKKENLILTVGRFSKLPNNEDFKKLGFMVNAFKEFQKKRLSGWKFAIVTSFDGEQQEELEKFEKNIKSNYIKVYKNAEYKVLKELYMKAKIYWHAAGFGEDIDKNPERAEHFGMSTVEAMSYGTVPVVINLGGQKEIVKNGENGFLWDTQKQLIDFTHKIATNKELMEQMAVETVATSQNFSKERFCEELNHLIW